MNSTASDASKVGPIIRNQLFNAYLVQRTAVCEDVAKRVAICSAVSPQFGSLDAARDEADAFRLLAGDRFAQQQVVLGLGHAAEQRPDDRRVVTGRDAKAGMAIDDLRVLRGNRNVREKPRDQPGAHGRAMHCGDDRLVAVDHVVDQVARFAPDARTNLEVGGHVLHQREVASRRKTLALASQDDGANLGVVTDVTPDARQFPVAVVIRGGELAGSAHYHLEHGLGMLGEGQGGVVCVTFNHVGCSKSVCRVWAGWRPM